MLICSAFLIISYATGLHFWTLDPFPKLRFVLRKIKLIIYYSLKYKASRDGFYNYYHSSHAKTQGEFDIAFFINSFI